ncbi:MAG TPA: MBL fold metallo-hydrolase [Dehalococcoidia bacterium]|nr:MBL fold metallo-hydrolase [Dehalococcoidia bacterium]
MNQADFEKLETLNAQIDVWIDEEEYRVIQDCLPLSKKAEQQIESCFGPTRCTKWKERRWSDALNWEEYAFPIETVIWPEKSQKNLNLKPIESYWSHLFYAKRIRAMIQERGTDCYFRRLDDVVAYLEKHLPPPPLANAKKAQRIQTNKLAVIYLLELSAAAEELEQLGFAQRAHRLIKNKRIEFGREFSHFYDLLARYNIGISYFHNSRYRNAVLEFNKIIYDLDMLHSLYKNEIEFFSNRCYTKLLYLPAVLYRADIQLKIQLAYHSLDTLHIYRKKFDDADKEYKKMKRDLIKAEAYQQMARLDKSSQCLSETCKKLFSIRFCRDNCFPYELEARKTDVCVPKVENGEYRQNIKGRFLSILMQHHLVYLSEIIGPLVEQTEKAPDWISRNLPYLRRLGTAFRRQYFRSVEYQSPNRIGYYEQLAEYLAWITKISETKSVKGDSHTTHELQKINSKLYQQRKLGILENEEKRNEVIEAGSCPQCKLKGIDLMRINPDHFNQFSDRMLVFYEKQFKGDRDIFTKRLIKLENNRDNLRINDLELRYQTEQVVNSLNSNYSNQYICWDGILDRSAFIGLLKCARVNSDGDKHVYLLEDHYEKVIKQWNRLFLRHLDRRSIHQAGGNGLYFAGLRRWNSSSPAKGRSVGGGYLIYHANKTGQVDLGIAIDPGFDFVRNLFHMGFSLRDIDIVLISHADLDHIRDFESIINLLFELSKRGKYTRRIHVILTLGVYKRLEHIIENPTYRHFLEPYIIDINKEISPDYFENLHKGPKFCFEHVPPEKKEGKDKKTSTEVLDADPQLMDYRAILPSEPGKRPNKDEYPRVEIIPTRAYHNDHSGYSDSFGFLVKIKLPTEDETIVTFGYTGDTKWIYGEIDDPISEERIKQGDQERVISDIATQYVSVDNANSRCNVILMHLGSLIDEGMSFAKYDQCDEDPEKEEACENLVRKNRHPYLIGVLRLLSTLLRLYDKAPQPKVDEPLILIGEFGEELRGGLRRDLIKRLRELYEGKFSLLPIDVGITIRLWSPSKEKGEVEEAESESHSYRVWCVQCDEFVPINESEFDRYGEDEALFCICKTCKEATSHDVIQERLRHLYEVGCELKTA